MELWIVLLIVGLAALAAGGMALAVWALLRRTDRKIAAYQNKLPVSYTHLTLPTIQQV